MSLCYKTLPIPSRTWSRVQGPCSLIIDNPNPSAFVTSPLTGKLVPLSEIGGEIAMLNKGNVLQYKKNSSCLTKNQKYSLIAQGRWNYNKTWATQSTRGYTNPNTLVCAVTNEAGDVEIIIKTADNLCHPSTASDVPGPIVSLCWNDRIVPWYPKPQYTMTSSGDKFPTNALLLSAAVVNPPVLSIIASEPTSISLSWTISEFGLPVTSFRIYQNSQIIDTILGIIEPNTNRIQITHTKTITGLIPMTTYEFYVIATSNTQPVRTDSVPSNVVTKT